MFLMKKSEQCFITMIFDFYIDFAKKQTNINKQDNQITTLTVTKKHKKKLFQ